MRTLDEVFSFFDIVIGLEVHAQLKTQTKMFCACSYTFGAPPNTQICPICTGQPGSLPVVNKKAIELGVRAALAFHLTIRQESIFSRKNYFYPDLPRGYQISQYDKPFSESGYIDIAEKKRVRIKRIHFEEDAGKSFHKDSQTLVDLNRAGVPLIEIVSEPDIFHPDDAALYLKKLHNTLQFLDICEGNMEEGHLRCDANISLKKKGETLLGTRVEIKNINSFKYVTMALVYESIRQGNLLREGQSIRQETRSWNFETKTTEPMRSKENEKDYRYFPDPDLTPLILSDEWVKSIQETAKKTPQKIEEDLRALGLSAYEASVLTSDKNLIDFFYTVRSSASVSPELISNWLLNELLGKLNEANCSLQQSPISPASLGKLLRHIEKKIISSKMAKDIFEKMYDERKEADDIIKELHLSLITDTKELTKICDKVITDFPDQVASYRQGKTKLFGFFVGVVMKETKGQASPQEVNTILKKLLN